MLENDTNMIVELGNNAQDAENAVAQACEASDEQIERKGNIVRFA